MPRKKKKKIPPLPIKAILGGVFVLGALTLIYFGVLKFFTEADYFKVKEVAVDKSLPFISQSDFTRIKGKNIFLINIRELQKKLNYRYPQVKDIQVLRQFPHRIYITAEQRFPFAQVQHRAQTITLDEFAYILSTTSKKDGTLPFVICPNISESRIKLGAALKTKEIKTASDIIKSFRINRNLSHYRIKNIDVRNLSKIKLELTNDLVVILDWDRIPHKINVLGLLLSQGKIEMNKTKYIDIRPKDPVIRTR